ncbi:MAG: SUMF1/EgtB/PvdO family nonheme iron enzyme [Planctomycetales bacterium]
MNEQAFLKEIAANPADDAPRLIFADWLEERGDLRAELLRLLNELIHIDVPDRAAKEARIRELLYEQNVPPVMPTFTNSIGMKFVQIPPGEFMMGAPEDEEQAFGFDKPRHQVTLTKPYWLGTTTVTQRQWTEVVGREPWKGDNCVKEGPDYPATHVNWEDSMEFCRRLSDQGDMTYRLPTEAEWDCAKKFGGGG